MAKARNTGQRNRPTRARTTPGHVTSTYSGPSANTAIEIAFWVIFLSRIYQSSQYYWRVVFITAASIRLLHLALRGTYIYLPDLDLQFANILVLGTWASAAVAYVVLVIYAFFLTPFHVFVYSPIDSWAKPVADQDLPDDFCIHYDPRSRTEVDIIAIHGLGSNPNTAWTRKRENKGSSVSWLRDLLPQDPQLVKARIVQVNHQTRWDIGVSALTFDEHAKNILQILEAIHKVRGRPIIFIAHSFGGLLLKRALVLANSEESPIATDARGLLFLGVPHGGTEAAFFASLLSCTAYWRGSSTSLLQYMAPGSDAIKDLELDFYKAFVLPKTYHRQVLPRIVDFIEQRGERIGPFYIGRMFNNRNQGIIHGEEVILNADHRGLIKFASLKDPNYQKFLAQVLLTVEYADKYSVNVRPELSPTNNVPFERDMKFVPRQNIVGDICERILSSKNHLRLALAGLGGVGKSQIAIEVSYSLRKADPDLWVFWIRAGSSAKFKDTYSLIAYTVGILKPEESDSSANLPSLVLSWLRIGRNGRWVIILDGADEMSVFYPDRADTSSPNYLSWLPRVDHGSVLITTRNRAISLNLIGSQNASNSISTIDKMSHEQAIQLLKSRVPEPLWDDENADAIVQELDYIPLAIGHAAAYIDYSADLLEEYLSKIRALQAQPSPKDEIHDSRRDDDASPSVIVTWQTSLDQIRATSETAAELLCLMSAFDNQNIPEFFIAKPMAVGYVDSLGEVDLVAQKYIEKYSNNDKRPDPPRRTETMDSLDAGRNNKVSRRLEEAQITNWLVQSDQRLRDDIGLLYNYQMISVDKSNNTYSMHGLVQAAITKWLESGGKTAYTLQDYRDRALIEVSMAFKLDGVPGIYEKIALHQNATKVLEYEISRKVTGLHRAEILYHQALYLQATDQLELAERFIKETIAIRRTYSVGYTLAVVKALEAHALICLDQRRHAAGEKIFRDALEGFSLSMGFFPNLKNGISMNLAVAMMNQGRAAEAKDLVEDVTKSESFRFGDDNTSVLEDRRILAGIYNDLGDKQRAIDELREVIAIWDGRESFAGKDLELMMICKFELLEFLIADNPKEAERLGERFVRTAQADLGEGNITTIRLQLGHSKALYALEKFEMAEIELRNARAQSLLVMEINHPMLEEVTLTLIDILYKRDKHSDIVAFGSTTKMYVEPEEKELSQLYWRAATQYAHSLHILKRLPEAKEAYELALPKMAAIHEDVSFGTAVWKFHYSECLSDLKLFNDCIMVLDDLQDWRNSEDIMSNGFVDRYDELRRVVNERLE